MLIKALYLIILTKITIEELIKMYISGSIWCTVVMSYYTFHFLKYWSLLLLNSVFDTSYSKQERYGKRILYGRSYVTLFGFLINSVSIWHKYLEWMCIDMHAYIWCSSICPSYIIKNKKGYIKHKITDHVSWGTYKIKAPLYHKLETKYWNSLLFCFALSTSIFFFLSTS